MTVFTRGGFAHPGTSLDFKTGAWRIEKPLHRHTRAPCHAACPAGEDAQAYVAKVQEDRVREAWEILVAVNPLPAVSGRVCPHPCEDECNRRHYDEAIAIHSIERFLGDEGLSNGWDYPPAGRASAAGEAIAVVGAGPAGLSAAYHLVRRGCAVTVFDALPEAGGLLRSAIPPTRLPRRVIDAEIERILALGIDFRPRQRLGRDMSLDELAADHRAVFLAPGAQRARDWSIDGAVPVNLRQGLELLKNWIDHGAIPTPNSAAIHGGGNTAVDLARVMKRAGVAEVHVITASGLPGPDTEPEDVINVVPRELVQAQEEGIVFHPHRTIQRLIMHGSRLVGLEVVRLKKLPRGDGRRARVAFEGTETVLHVEAVIPAIGEVVDASGIEKLIGQEDYLPCDDWGRLKGHPGIFAGGDALADRGTVSEAIGDGRRAAEAIERYLRSAADPEEEDAESIAIDALNLNYFDRAPRVEEAMLPVAERTNTKEIAGALAVSGIAREAARCFSCGDCIACDNCWTLCPDNAVIKTVETASDGSHYLFDYDYCKGCGLCARECPCGYIEMVDEGERLPTPPA